VFQENEELDAVIVSLTELRDAFTITKSGEIAKSSRGFKALPMGGKLAAIPASLKGYEKFLRSKDPAGLLLTFALPSLLVVAVVGPCLAAPRNGPRFTPHTNFDTSQIDS
jgi:hypothetical protein